METKTYYVWNVANARRITMTSKPARLGKCNAHEVMEKQLTISVMELVFITFLVFLFFLLSFILIPQTFGFL